jgi:hypothetical protein
VVVGVTLGVSEGVVCGVVVPVTLGVAIGVAVEGVVVVVATGDGLVVVVGGMVCPTKSLGDESVSGLVESFVFAVQPQQDVQTRLVAGQIASRINKRSTKPKLCLRRCRGADIGCAPFRILS